MRLLSYNIKTDVRSIKPLLFVAKWLAIIPDSQSSVYFNYFHPAIMTIIIIASYVGTLYGKLKMGTIFEPTVRVIDLGTDFSIMITNVCCVVGVNIIKRKTTLNLFTQLRKIDHDLRYVKKDCSYPCTWFYLELIFAHVFYFTYAIYDVTLWTNTLGISVYKYYIVKQYQSYHIIILAMVLRYYALMIKYRFETLNRILCKLNDGDGIATLLEQPVGQKLHLEDFWEVKKVTKLYTKLSMAVDLYTEVFGWCFVTLYICIIINLLMPIDIAMIYGSGNKQMLGTTFGLALVMLCVLWALFPLLVTAAIFSACETCAAEAAKMPNTCYNLIHDLSFDEKHNLRKTELKELAEQANDKRVQFTAAGFFTVNYNIIFSMVGSITSYLIVLIQFHK